MTEISKAFIHERDEQIYAARAAGASTTELSKKFGMTLNAVNTAIRRHIDQLNRTAVLAYPEVLAMELDRLDKLQRAIWPLTQHRIVEMDDGTQIKVEPDMKAVDQTLRIMQARAKLMGLDVTQISLHSTSEGGMAQVPEPQHTLKGSERPEEIAETAEEESRALLELWAKSNMADEGFVRALLDDNVIEAEVVEDEEDEQTLD